MCHKLFNFFLITFSFSFASGSINAQQKVKYHWQQFVMGADLSYVNEVEDFHGIYKDSGLQRDPFVIFKDHGCNTVRVRLWHDPKWVADVTGGKRYSDLADVEKTMQRAKAQGMAVNLDLHYSDDWADPNKQPTPAAWEGLSLDVLKDSVFNYTLSVLNYFKEKALVPEMIQVGNETNFGMLWPVGKIDSSNGSGWKGFGILLVVLGHLLQSQMASADDNFVYRLIYARALCE